MAIATPVKPDIQPAALPDNPTPNPVPVKPTVFELLATPDAFARWLLDKASDDLVGFSRTSVDCPLANWLSSCAGYSVRVGSLNVSGPQTNSRLPGWASNFITHVDSNIRFSSVTASEALGFLDQSVRP